MTLARRKLAVLVLVAVVACGDSGLIKSFRIALASSGPLVNSLAASGVIPQTKATAIIADFNDGAGCALTLQNEFNAIPDDVSEREQTARKLNASARALRCWRTIIDRHNFSAHARVQQAADIAEGILASMVVFYSEPGDMRASAADSASVTVRDEKELEAKLKVQVKELERALKP